MKSMDDVKNDMSELYEEVRSGLTDLKTADSLANITGKYLKAEGLQLARDIFLEEKRKHFTAALPVISDSSKMDNSELVPITS